MSVQKIKSVRYWPTLKLSLEGGTVEVAVYKEDGAASYVRRSVVEDLPEIMETIYRWLVYEGGVEDPPVWTRPQAGPPEAESFA